MEKFQTSDIPKSPRIQKLVDALYEHMPVIESARAKLITESYKETEGEPIITRRAKAFAHILHNIPIIIRDNELIVGSSTIAPSPFQLLLTSHLARFGSLHRYLTSGYLQGVGLL